VKEESFQFWAIVYKTDRPTMSDRYLSCPVCLFVLSVCNVRVLAKRLDGPR